MAANGKKKRSLRDLNIFNTSNTIDQSSVITSDHQHRDHQVPITGEFDEKNSNVTTSSSGDNYVDEESTSESNQNIASDGDFQVSMPESPVSMPGSPGKLQQRGDIRTVATTPGSHSRPLMMTASSAAATLTSTAVASDSSGVRRRAHSAASAHRHNNNTEKGGSGSILRTSSPSPQPSRERSATTGLLHPHQKLSPKPLLVPPHQSSSSSSSSIQARSLTLWDYLILELADNDYTIFTHDKLEHLLNIIKIPAYLERVVLFGMLTCLDSFLYTFTILPLRVFAAILKVAFFRSSTARKADILKGLILVIVLYILLQLDTSKIYHNIRGQAAIKLYVMFNVLEIADKLCSALGQDITEGLFSLTTLTSSPFRILGFSIMAGIYCYAHCLVLLYQIITLNVAVNSYSNALLTLLLSNQFSEIKAAVFKKFEREELFQLTCADITERFQLLVILLVIGVRNVVEVSNVGVIPASWAGWNRWLGALFGPAIVVVGSEVLVDCMKHAYITKFNSLKPRIYRKFLDVLCVDYADNAFSDQVMTKRTGFPVFPLAIVTAKMLLQSYYILAEQTTDYIVPPPQIAVVIVKPSSSPSSSFQFLFEKLDLFINKIGFWGYPSAASESPTINLETAASANTNILTSLSSSSFLSFDLLSWLNVVIISTSMFLVLLFIKLVLGVLLLRYSSRRHAFVRRHRQSRIHKSHDDFSDVKPMGMLDEKFRRGLYEPEEDVPQSKKPKNSSTSDGYSELFNVSRFRMASKRIW